METTNASSKKMKITVRFTSLAILLLLADGFEAPETRTC
jgi:hypothetical protein